MKNVCSEIPENGVDRTMAASPYVLTNAAAISILTLNTNGLLIKACAPVNCSDFHMRIKPGKCPQDGKQNPPCCYLLGGCVLEQSFTGAVDPADPDNQESFNTVAEYMLEVKKLALKGALVDKDIRKFLYRVFALKYGTNWVRKFTEAAGYHC